MNGVLPAFFEADFIAPETGATTSQYTGIPSFSSQDPLVTIFLLQIPAGNIGTSVVQIRLPNSNVTAISFNFTYVPDTTPTISLVEPREVSALGGLAVQLFTAHLTDAVNGMQMQINFGNQTILGSYKTTQQTVDFIAPFTHIVSQQTTSVQMLYQDTVLNAQVAHLPLPRVEYIECSGSSTCAGTAGASITVDVWVSHIPISCGYRPDGCTASTYLPGCSDQCTDVIADFGSHGHGLVTLINHVGSRTLIRIETAPFLASSLGIVTAELQIHSDSRFTMQFDIMVEAAGTPTLVGDYSNIYLLTTGSQQVNVEITNMQVVEASQLEVTYDGIGASVSEFSVNSVLTQISFSFLSPALADSKSGGRAQVVVTKLESKPVLSVAFSAFIKAAPVPTFDSASPPFIVLSSQAASYPVSILVQNVLAYNAAASAVNFTTAELIVHAQNVVVSRPSSSNNLLQLDVTLPANVQAGSWDVSIALASGSAPLRLSTYLITDPVPQVLSIRPAAAHTSEQIVLSTRHLSLTTSSFSATQVQFITQTGSMYYAIVTALTDETVTVQVPEMGQTSNINSIDVAITTSVGTALLEKAFDWKAPFKPTPIRISPSYGLNYGGFGVVASAEGFVSASNSELTASDFFVNFGGTSVTNFAVTHSPAAESELLQGIHEFTFRAPLGLVCGSIKIQVGLVDSLHRNVSYDIRIDDANVPYLSGLIHPSYCYTQGGGTVSALVKGFPLSADTSAVINWAGQTNVTAQTTTTVTSGSSKDVQVTFVIPKSGESTTHTEAVSIMFTSASPQITVSSDFVYRAMPAPVISMNVSKAIYSGGTYILLTLRNLGPHATASELIVLFASHYKAVVVSTVCQANPSACETGLVECAAVVITPQMSSLNEMGNVLVQAYWSDVGLQRAASSEDLEIFNPLLPNIPVGSMVPEEGYLTENTEVVVQVYGLVFSGQHYSEKDDIHAYFTPKGSTTQLPIVCTGNQRIESSEGGRNSITLIMPIYTTAATVQITVQLKQVFSVKAMADFTYYAIPSVAPQIQANPLTGPLAGGTTVLIELSSFYLCPLTTDLAVEFIDSSLSQYIWNVDWVSSTFEKTTVEASTPLITNPVDVYDSTTGAMQELSVRVYPQKLVANKATYGAVLGFKYKPFNPVITELSPATGLVVGGTQGRMTLENVGGITEATQLQIRIGQSMVSSVSVTETLDAKLSVEFVVPSGSVGLAEVFVQFTDSQQNAFCDPAACNGFNYTTLTGAAILMSGPSPSRIMSTATQTEIKLSVSNFLPVSGSAALTVSCNGNLLVANVSHYQANGAESYITLQIPPISITGTYSCVLQQRTDYANPANFILTVVSPETSVKEIYPKEAVAGDLMTVSISNIAPAALTLVWLSSSTWTELSLWTAQYIARLAREADGVWSGGTVVTFGMPDAGTSSPIRIGIRDAGADTNLDEVEVTQNHIAPWPDLRYTVMLQVKFVANEPFLKVRSAF